MALNAYIIKSYTGFVYLSMYHMPGYIAGQLAAAQQLNSFLCIKSKAFTRLFFCSINKAVLYHFFMFWRGLYSFFSSSRRLNIRHIPDNGIQNAKHDKKGYRNIP